MRRLLVRRSLTAVGIYSAVLLGFLATVLASRELPSTRAFGDFATVVFATGFFQSFFDLTVEEALVKYGFRYVTREDWGRLRRLFGSAFRFKLAGSTVGAAALVIFAFVGPDRLQTALLLAAGIPLAQSLEGFAAAPLYLRSRYDIRGLFLAWSMTLRLVGIATGARHGLDAAVGAVLAAQVVATASVAVAGWYAFHRFPPAASRPLGEDRRSIVAFIAQSSVATGVLALRGGLAPLLLGAVTGTTQVGLFKVAQSPQTGFQALSAPARMVLLTEQTREWERGRQAAVLQQVRRYSLVAFCLALLVVPPMLVFAPDLIRLINGARYVGAANAARLLVVAAGVQLVVGWTKSFPVTIGRPQLRIWTHGLETIVVLPLVVAFGAAWGATGAALAVLIGVCVFAAVWAVIFVRIRPEEVQAPLPLAETLAETEAETGVLSR
jgi:O-antigen/teichoic acid export membrane protein